MKNTIRLENKNKRKLMTIDDVLTKSEACQMNFLKTSIYKNAQCIMIYKPLGNETKTDIILNKAISDGKKIVYPVTDEQSGIITPYFADEKTLFKKGAFSVSEPVGVQKTPLDDIDVVIVPGIAFDKSGGRIGFGKGCYDMFLKGFNPIKIGFCYDFQISRSIPTDDNDVKMDYIISENGFFKCFMY